jgi:hypothetical protein
MTKPILPPLYTKLLLLVVVIGPFFWLVFTDDGQRRTDLVLLHLMGREQVNLAIEHLTPTLTEADFRKLYPDLELTCGAGGAPFGDRLCGARIGAFNQIPARALSLFLTEDRLAAVRVDYRRGYHEDLRAQLERRVGRPQTDQALSWPVSDGVLLMPVARPASESEAALFWLSPRAVNRKLQPVPTPG